MKIKNLTASVTHRILAMEFVAEFIVIYPFYTIMFGQRGHVSALGIGVLLATWQILSVVAEVPTGIIADRLSKKWVLVLAKVLRVFAFSTWLFFPSFIGYLIGFAIWGVADALSSGAFQAYLYESLPGESKNKFGHVYSRVSAMTMLSFTIAYLFSFAIGTRYNLLLVLSVLASGVSLAIALSLPAGTKIVKTKERPRIFASAVRHIMQTVSLKQLFLGGVIIGSLASALIEYMALYYTQVGAPARVVPLLMALGNIFGALLFWHMSKFEGLIAKYRLLIVAISAALFLFSFLGNTASQIIGMMWLVRVVRLLQVHYESSVQHLAKDETRATIGSVYSFGAKLMAAGILTAVGASAATGNIIVGSLRYAVFIVLALFAISQIILWYRKLSVGKTL